MPSPDANPPPRAPSASASSRPTLAGKGTSVPQGRAPCGLQPGGTAAFGSTSSAARSTTPRHRSTGRTSYAAWREAWVSRRGSSSSPSRIAWTRFFARSTSSSTRARGASPSGARSPKPWRPGRAVIASRESGAAELFDDGTNAVAFGLGDAGALAAGIVDLVAARRRRDMLGSAARSAAVERFSRARLAKQVLDVYANAGIRRARVDAHSLICATSFRTASTRSRAMSSQLRARRLLREVGDTFSRNRGARSRQCKSLAAESLGYQRPR